LESFFLAFLEKEHIEIDLDQPEVMENPIAPFTTTTFEALMPFLTLHYGKNIPAELHIKIKSIRDINCSEGKKDKDKKTGNINLKADLDCECVLKYQNGRKASVGHADLRDIKLSVNLT
jgi:hypothetical protein